MTPPPIPKRSVLSNPFETPTPVDKDDDDDTNAVSQVTDFAGMFKKMGKLDENILKITRAVDRMTSPLEHIPIISEKVDNLSERVTRVEEQLNTTKDKVGELNGVTRKPHDCFQVDNIERIEVTALGIRKDREDDTKKIALIGADVEDIKTNSKSVKEVRRSSFITWAVTFVGLLSSILGAVWYMRGVSADIQIESQARSMQFQHVEQILNKVSAQSDPSPVVQQIKQLRTSMEESADIETWCSKLSNDDIQKMKTALPRQAWPKCAKLIKQ